MSTQQQKDNSLPPETRELLLPSDRPIGESVFNYPATQPSFAREPNTPLRTALVAVPVQGSGEVRPIQVHFDRTPSVHTRRPSEKTVPLLTQEPVRNEGLPRQWNTGQELESVVTMLGVKKKDNPIDKTIFLAILAGCWFVFAGLFAVAVTGGLPADFRKMYPAVPKMLVAITFPVGIIFLLLFGGELFTGNTMIMVVAWLNIKCTLKDLAINWTVSFVVNTGSVLFFTWLLGYVTDVFATDPWLTYLHEIAERKANLPVYKCIIMGIPANALVCLAFFLGLAARDVTGKILGLYLPVATFAACGWEHCIANIFYIGLGAMYGADVTFANACRNVFSVAIGNTIGGGILIGASEYYLYHWHADFEPTKHSKIRSILKKEKPKDDKSENTLGPDLEKGKKH